MADPARSWAQLTLASGLGTLVLGGMALGGWVLGSELLMAIRPGWIPMAPSTAALFVLFGVLTLLDARDEDPGAAATGPRLVAGAAGTGAAMVLLVLSGLGISPGAEHLWLEISGEVSGAPLGHMSPVTALGFVLAGSACVGLVLPPGYRRPRASFALGVLVVFLGLTLTTAYFLSRPLLYRSGSIPPALNTALAFTTLGGAILGAAARRIWVGGHADELQPKPVYPALGILALTAVLAITPAYFLFGDYAAGFRTDVETQLLDLADSKVDQIQLWGMERVSDASTFHTNALFADLLEAAFYQGDARAADRIRNWLHPVLRAYQYRRIAVMDSTGETRLVVPDTAAHAMDASHAAVEALRAMRSGNVTLEGFHGDASEDPVHLTAIAPVLGDDGVVLGAVTLRADLATQHLSSTLMRWPTPSGSAETLLLRRDGDAVVYLSDLRFRDNAALNLRLPVSDTGRVSVRAVLGTEGIIEGLDYRGEPVIAAARSVPDTDWWLVAQMGVDEAFAPLRTRLAWTVALVVFLLLAATGILGFGWQRREKLHYRQLARGEQRHRTLLQSIGDAVIATDSDGRVEVMNPVAETLTGWSREEALGRPIEDVFTIVNEETRRPVESPVHEVLREGRVVGLANSTMLVARDGTERPIADSGAPVRDETGALTGVVLVFRDQTRERRAQRLLAAREERYHNLFNSIRDAILVADTDRRIVDCNPAFMELFGYEKDEILGRPTSHVYASDDEFQAMGKKLRTRIGDPSFILTVRYRKKSGEIFPGETNTFYLRDSDGEIAGFIGLIRDVTERVATDRALKESEARYRALYEDAPVGIFRTRSDGQTLAVNQTMAGILGFESPDEAVDYYHDLAGQLYLRPERRAEGMRQLRENGFLENFQYEARRPDGTIIWLAMNARVADQSPDGTFDIEGFAWDITGQKEAEQALRQQQTMLERTERIAGIGSWEMDVETGAVTWSDEMFRIFQRNPDRGAASLEEHTEFLPPSDMNRLQTAVQDAVKEGHPYDVELQVQGPGKTVRHVRTRGFPETGPDGEVARLYGLVEDVTEWKRRQAREAELSAQLTQAQKMEAVGRLAGGVAHDFNNMLSVILGHVELAQQSLDPEHALHPDLEEIRQAAENSANLTRQLLAFAREQVANPEVLALNDIIANMLGMLRRLIPEDIELRWRPDDTVWPVKVDPVQVNQVLANLVVNARDAIDGVGRVTIETRNVSVDESYAELHPDAVPGDYVILAVTDTGTGMDPETLAHAFDPFFTTKDPGQGTGLGLATVYGVVRQNHGFITVYSEPGHGTTFSLHFTRFEGTASPTARPAKRVGPATGSETVLVVEDQPAVLGLVKKILERLGYTVLPAGTPAEAMELARDHGSAIRLLVTDVVMPEMNGRQLAERLLDEQPDLAILFMSGYAEDVIADRGVIEAGVHFVEKPFTAVDLAAKVRQALDESAKS